MIIISLQGFLADLWSCKLDDALGMLSKESSRNNKGNVGKQSVAGYSRSFFSFEGAIRTSIQVTDNSGIWHIAGNFSANFAGISC